MSSQSFWLIFGSASTGIYAFVSNRSPHFVQVQRLRTNRSLTNSDQSGAISASPHLTHVVAMATLRCLFLFPASRVGSFLGVVTVAFPTRRSALIKVKNQASFAPLPALHCGNELAEPPISARKAALGFWLGPTISRPPECTPLHGLLSIFIREAVYGVSGRLYSSLIGYEMRFGYDRPLCARSCPWQARNPTSALPQEADSPRKSRHVRKVPRGDLARPGQLGSSGGSGDLASCHHQT